MPSSLEHTIVKIDAGLPVVSTRDDTSSFAQPLIVTVEFTNVDLHQVAEGFIAKQNFGTSHHGVTYTYPLVRWTIAYGL
jgi:hypothetical protein